MLSPFWLGLLSALPLLLNSASAQGINDPRLYPGARVRLTVHAYHEEKPGRRIALLRAVTPESVHVHWIGEAGSDTIPWRAVSRIEVSGGVNRELRDVAVIIGVIGGTILGYDIGRRASNSLKTECSGGPGIEACGDTWLSFTARYAIALAGGAAGGGLAVLVTGRERWHARPIPGGLSMLSDPGGATRAVRIAAAIRW